MSSKQKCSFKYEHVPELGLQWTVFSETHAPHLFGLPYCHVFQTSFYPTLTSESKGRVKERKSLYSLNKTSQDKES